MPTLAPGARWYPSPINHPKRSQTLGVCIHNTYGSEGGDLATLTSGAVDCHFYVTKSGKVYQLLPLWSTSWTAMHTANYNSIHIEHEGTRETPWTRAQFTASVKLVAWLARFYKVPVRHVDPPAEWHGLYDHRDLQGVDGNDHGDGVPPSFPGWPTYLDHITHSTKPRITLRQRLAKAGFGKTSVDAIVSGKAKAPRSTFGRLIRAGFGKSSADKLTGYDPNKTHGKV